VEEKRTDWWRSGATTSQGSNNLKWKERKCESFMYLMAGRPCSYTYLWLESFAYACLIVPTLKGARNPPFARVAHRCLDKSPLRILLSTQQCWSCRVLSKSRVYCRCFQYFRQWVMLHHAKRHLRNADNRYCVVISLRPLIWLFMDPVSFTAAFRKTFTFVLYNKCKIFSASGLFLSYFMFSC